MRGMSLASLLLGLAVAGPGLAGDQEPARQDERPGLAVRRTGDGTYFYHNVRADCETVEHAHGRNAAWGLWRMPLSEVSDQPVEPGERGGFNLTLQCVDGSNCIGAGRLDVVSDHTSAHAIPFETREQARAFADELGPLRLRCGEL